MTFKYEGQGHFSILCIATDLHKHSTYAIIYLARAFFIPANEYL